ncbi:MAG: hypothetical protein ACR2FM_04900 [Candidatus Saccharimonadales bacterium]
MVKRLKTYQYGANTRTSRNEETIMTPNSETERPANNLFGKTLNKLRGERMSAVGDAKSKMMARHNISPRDHNKYKIVEDRTVRHRDGQETIELRLYELKDAAVVTISTSVTSELQGGINNLREFDDNGR